MQTIIDWMTNDIQKKVDQIIALAKQFPPIERVEQALEIKTAELNKCYGIEKGYHAQWNRISIVWEHLADWQYDLKNDGSLKILIAQHNALQAAKASKKYWRAVKLKMKYKL